MRPLAQRLSISQTVNTTERIESTGEPGKIHVSEEYAKLLEGTSRESWLSKRDTVVSAKGKGTLEVRQFLCRHQLSS